MQKFLLFLLFLGRTISGDAIHDIIRKEIGGFEPASETLLQSVKIPPKSVTPIQNSTPIQRYDNYPRQNYNPCNYSPCQENNFGVSMPVKTKKTVYLRSNPAHVPQIPGYTFEDARNFVFDKVEVEMLPRTQLLRPKRHQ
eukprot:GHVP01025050.1.p1 GENE.GHVP01025050.1~~GHVP01025050.1.p1  ORF type:complete len:140 (+),score=13.31 GHVP01025050.1:49-468(+)